MELNTPTEVRNLLNMIGGSFDNQQNINTASSVKVYYLLLDVDYSADDKELIEKIISSSRLNNYGTLLRGSSNVPTNKIPITFDWNDADTIAKGMQKLLMTVTNHHFPLTGIIAVELQVPVTDVNDQTSDVITKDNKTERYNTIAQLNNQLVKYSVKNSRSDKNHTRGLLHPDALRQASIINITYISQKVDPRFDVLALYVPNMTINKLKTTFESKNLSIPNNAFDLNNVSIPNNAFDLNNVSIPNNAFGPNNVSVPNNTFDPNNISVLPQQDLFNHAPLSNINNNTATSIDQSATSEMLPANQQAQYGGNNDPMYQKYIQEKQKYLNMKQQHANQAIEDIDYDQLYKREKERYLKLKNIANKMGIDTNNLPKIPASALNNDTMTYEKLYKHEKQRYLQLKEIAKKVNKN